MDANKNHFWITKKYCRIIADGYLYHFHKNGSLISKKKYDDNIPVDYTSTELSVENFQNQFPKFRKIYYDNQRKQRNLHRPIKPSKQVKSKEQSIDEAILDSMKQKHYFHFEDIDVNPYNSRKRLTHNGSYVFSVAKEKGLIYECYNKVVNDKMERGNKKFFFDPKSIPLIERNNKITKIKRNIENE